MKPHPLDIMREIKNSIPFDPENTLSHSDAFEDSDALKIIERVIEECARTH